MRAADFRAMRSYLVDQGIRTEEELQQMHVNEIVDLMQVVGSNEANAMANEKQVGLHQIKNKKIKN